jgi:hypothetical protein
MEALRNSILFPLLIVWAGITAVLIILFAWRGVLEGHEEDQVFLDAAQNHMAQEQRMLVARIDRLSKPIHYLMVASGGLLAIMAGIWLWQIYKAL